jgi:serine phosphatase RsbU (regulator of sigma subunit)
LTTTQLDTEGPVGSEDAAPQPVVASSASRGHGAALTVLVLGLVLTGVLVWTSWSLNNHNEARLLNLQGKQVGSLLAAAIPNIQTPLELSAEAAQASGGDVTKFRQIMDADVQAKGGFSSASLWRNLDGSVEPVATVGKSQLAPSSAQARALMARSFQQSTLAVVELEGGGRTYLGFALALPGTGERFAVYGERPLPADRRASVASNAAFSDLNYAIYLGPHQNAEHLLTTDIAQFPVSNPKTVVSVPFGDTVLTTVVTARTPLGGTLSAWLPGIFAILGVLLTLGAAWITERLVRRRRMAELAATEVRHLYGELGTLYEEQRSIAETLQRALLPQTMPSIRGLEIVSRYVPGAQGVEIGGDWYSIVKLDDDNFFFAVGDVSGRGLDAAAVMARMRYTAPAYAFDGDSPTQILDKSTNQLDVNLDGHFATALIGVGNVVRNELVLANAGHPLPYVLGGGTTGFIQMPINVPLGVEGGPYRGMNVTTDLGSTLIAYTDGLIERREEDLDVGLQRLDEAIRRHADDSLDDLVSNIISDLVGDASEDDVAILALRWTG